MARDEHPLRIGAVRQKQRIADAPPVNGARNRSKAVTFSAMPPVSMAARIRGWTANNELTAQQLLRL